MKITKTFHEHLNRINDLSKKSILIIGTVVLSILNSHATTLTSNLNTTTIGVDITNENLVKVYDWKVETNTGYAKGYSSTQAYAHKMMQLVASGDAIVSKKIISQPQQ